MDHHCTISAKSDDVVRNVGKSCDTQALSMRTAILVWLIATSTTILSLVLALVGEERTATMFGLVSATIIMAVGSFKAWLILRYYLGLGPSAAGWHGLFVAFLIVIFAGVLAAQGAVIVSSH